MTSPVLDATAFAVETLAAIPLSADAVAGLDDATLFELSRLGAAAQNRAATVVAFAAGEIARRSAPALGSDGLAQRLGLHTPENLVRVTTGTTAREAKQSVRVGRVVVPAALDEVEPWMRPVAAAMTDADLSPASVDAIRSGLGAPTATLTSEQLEGASVTLCAEAAAGLGPDALFKRARRLRDALDAAGITEREQARRDQRSLTFKRLPDGMALLTWRLDPESAAVCGELFDRATSPRRGGPRFVDESAAAHAAQIADDPRTTEQLASDTFLELLRHGACTDSSRLLGSGGAIVRVVVRADDLTSGTGAGHFEGQTDAVSIATVERLACSGATQEVTVDGSGRPLDVGREQRLFTHRQRIALAVRDGGCMWPDCDRPPSWTEAHHVRHWRRDHGHSDVANGILLCRHHHLLLHNNGWEIRYAADGGFELVPPASVDPSRAPRPMPSKSPLRPTA
jgi:hypothetical protein